MAARPWGRGRREGGGRNGGRRPESSTPPSDQGGAEVQGGIAGAPPAGWGSDSVLDWSRPARKRPSLIAAPARTRGPGLPAGEAVLNRVAFRYCERNTK